MLLCKPHLKMNCCLHLDILDIYTPISSVYNDFRQLFCVNLLSKP